ncbi:VWA domain-containing protein [Brevibacillus borstelensis]|jgi:Ca-activated chloride channel homolog|uniref:vWA domain-containing protein n=1 Tax=Brevibacillus borstelensis TaxID=45462 RepID=UPI002E1F04E3|nr:VWA domain-containing protein [Brevibacillus borstelensis]
MKKQIVASALALVTLTAAGCSSGEKQAVAPSEKAGRSVESKAEHAVQNQAQYAAPSSAMDRTVAKRSAPAPAGSYNGMHFKNYGTNPAVDAAEDHLSTFAADVDTGSYSVMRNYITRGSLPPADAVRVEEFINYFPLSYEPPAKDAFAIHTDGGPSPFRPGYDLLRIGIKGKEIAVTNRKPANLVFVIDISGSMNQENRLELVKKSLRVLVDQLEEKDKVGIVVYGSKGRKLLDPTSAQNKAAIIESLDYLLPEGSTNAEEGLRLGYEMAAQAFSPDAINRVILCSDGVANVGETTAEGILSTIERYAGEGITLSTLGFGMGNYNDVLMEQLADKGDGTYSYIDTFSEARRVFTEALTGTLQTIAHDAKIQVEFDPKAVETYRLLGYENRDVADEDFRNDRVDGGEIGAGHTVTALYEIKRKRPEAEKLGTVRVRYKDEKTSQAKEVAEPMAIGKTLQREVQFLASVAEFAEMLRGSEWAEGNSLKKVADLAEKTATGEQQLEFVRLVKDALALRGS